ncbi:hypothetical protein VN97_g11978 [Penicillium thymicola]|uniref:Serine/threonine-protein kinase ATG1 n=1 Tax=Penicillium thymicola TaxID=293382 RepID=A0AAI9X2V9_PENTH|nr:hypothetical protein VN97_g11978 [Penicillium thymicola]
MTRTELVNDMKLDAEVHPDGTSHPTFQPDYAQGTTGRWRPKVEIWKRGRILGAGTFGTVWIEKCVPSEGPARVRAVKVIKKSSDPSEQIYCDQELEAMAKFSRPRVGLFVECLGWFEDQQFIFIAMEHMELGDLQHYLRNPLPENEARQICAQLLRGIQCLHDNQFVHRDLKPGNVLVVNEGPNWHVKIGDFGVSKRYEKAALQSKVGTPLYLAPELLGLYPPGTSLQKLRLYTHRVDIWSLGVMVFYVLCHDYPFPSDNSLSLYVRTSNFPPYRKLRSVTQEGQRFLECLLAADATVRLSAKEALQDGWLKQPSFDPVSGISRIGLSKTVGSNPIGTSREASRGWDDGEVSSAIVDDQTSWAARRPQRKSTGLQQSKSERQTPISGLSDDLNRAHNRGLSLLSQKKHAKAQKMLQKAFELREHALGAHHEDTLASLHSLGDALSYRDKDVETEFVYRNAWEGRKRALGEAHEDTLASLDGLGDALTCQNKYAEAESVYRNAWEGRKRALGEAHEDTLASLDGLGDALTCQNKYAEAEELYRQAWKACKEAFGAKDETTLGLLHDLARALDSHGKYTQAEILFRQAWEGRNKTLGVNDSSTLESLDHLSINLASQQRWSKAETLQCQVYKGYREMFGASSPETLRSLHALGIIFNTQRKYAEAEVVFRKAWKRRSETLGANHEDTLESLGYLRDVSRSSSPLSTRKPNRLSPFFT